MSENVVNLKSRIVHKHDIEAHWKLATNFSPLAGEMIIYDPDENNENARIKIGDGKTNVNDLPFIKDYATSSLIENHEKDTTIHITELERQTWNSKSNFSGSYNDLTNKPEIPVKSVNGKTGAVQLSAEDVGADPKGSAANALADSKAYIDKEIASIPTPDVSGQINAHNVNTSAHEDIRLLLAELIMQVNSFLDVDDTTRDQLSEILRDIDANKTTIESITSGKVNVTDIINNLTTNVTDKPLSASQGVVLKGLIDALQETTKTLATKKEMTDGDEAISERINEAINKISQPDWSQNDETAKDYIKNRTHYVINSEEGELLYDKTISGFQNDYDNIYITSFNADIPEYLKYIYTFKVVWDGVEYICENIRNSGGLYLMNPSVILGNVNFKENSDGEPFCIYLDIDNQFIRVDTNTSDSTHTLKIIEIYEDVKQLSSKYISNDIARSSEVEEIAYYLLDEVYTKASQNDLDDLRDLVGDTSVSDQINELTETFATANYVDKNIPVINILENGTDYNIVLQELLFPYYQNSNSYFDKYINLWSMNGCGFYVHTDRYIKILSADEEAIRIDYKTILYVGKPNDFLLENGKEYTQYIDILTDDVFGQGMKRYHFTYTVAETDGVYSITDISYAVEDRHNIATEEYVNTAVAGLVDSAPDALNTLNKLAAAFEALKNSIPRVSEITLLANGWTGEASPYSQVVEIEGITEYSQVDLKPSVEQLNIFHHKDIGFVAENEDGIITVYVIGKKPENDYVIQVSITEVNT